MSGFINTFTGKKFAPLDPKVEDIDILDIAQALSNMCRFTGHVRRFYSVAEHSCRVHDIVHGRQLREDMSGFGPWLENLQWALMHDAAEAYLIDVARPVKVQPAMSFYRDAEDRLLSCIAEHFGMRGHAPPASVQDVDRKIATNEARVLLNMREDLWQGRDGLPDADFNSVQMGDSISNFTLGWSPDTARFEFLCRFRNLFGAGYE